VGVIPVTNLQCLISELEWPMFCILLGEAFRSPHRIDTSSATRSPHSILPWPFFFLTVQTLVSASSPFSRMSKWSPIRDKFSLARDLRLLFVREYLASVLFRVSSRSGCGIRDRLTCAVSDLAGLKSGREPYGCDGADQVNPCCQNGETNTLCLVPNIPQRPNALSKRGSCHAPGEI
jgi:hypothetical protein